MGILTLYDKDGTKKYFDLYSFLDSFISKMSDSVMIHIMVIDIYNKLD